MRVRMPRGMVMIVTMVMPMTVVVVLGHGRRLAMLPLFCRMWDLVRARSTYNA